jgi:pectate lyase
MNAIVSKKYWLILLLLLGAMQAHSLTVTKSGGWFEAAWAEWQPVSGADSYNVYYSGEGVSEQKIDAQLIRSYGSYLRADVPGLKAGAYTLKIAPVTNGTEGAAATTGTLNVMAHDRSGFAFANNRVPGAYKANGTPKDGAVILYITQSTKNTVSLDVTGASANPCVGLQTILDGFKKGKDTRPLIIRMVGQITDFLVMQSGDIVIENSNNASSFITLEGIGTDATADGWGIRIKNASNIEIRNIGIMNVNSSEGDNIGLQQNNDYIWVHNVDFFYGGEGGDSDQAKGDGALDCKKSTYVTFSYNHFWDTGKSNLLGLSENTTEGLFITYHHNWYDHSDSRHPRVRFYSAHVYNNYYDGIAKYGVGSTMGSSVFVEGNYFRNAKYPILISMQGSDVWDESANANDYGDMPTFSKEDGGIIKAYNNHIQGARRFVAYGDTSFTDSTNNFDAYVAQTRNEPVSSSVQSAYGNNTYNNFDTDNSIMYSYTAQSPQEARTTVMAYAGRMDGGDFKWTFNNEVDDASYAVNSALKSALMAYETSLVAIQGEGSVVINPSSSSEQPSSSTQPSSSSESSSNTGTSSSSATSITADIIHNYTTDGLNSEYFVISGNLSTSKGTVQYDGLTLTQCLKMESSTSIAFSLSVESRLTLVFNSDFSGTVQINGTNYPVNVGGIIQTTLPAGNHTITKGDVGNLFFMSLHSNEQPTKVTTVANEALYLDNNNILHIYNQTAQSIKLFRFDGTLVQTYQATNQIALNGLATGVYYVQIIGLQATQTARIVIQN